MKYYIPLFISIMMFLAVVLPMVGLPYCYSEAQLLGDSVFFMKDQGIGLVFNGKAVELPDLYALIMAVMAREVSCEPVVLHLISVVWAALSIFAAFKFGKFFFSVQAGVISASIMTLQNVFLAQSGLVLPVMMLNACVLGGMYLFFREKYGWCVVLMSAAALTDIVGLAAAAYLLVEYLRIKNRDWSVSKSILMALPVALWIVYEMVSIHVCGKFSIRHSDAGFSFGNFLDNARFVFVAQYRWAITAVLITALAVNLTNKNKFFFIKDITKKSVAMFAVILSANSVISPVESWNLTPISMTAIFAGCAISTLNTSYYGKYIVGCALMASSALGLTQRGSVSDSYVNYKSKVKVDQKTVELVEQTLDSNTTILCDRFMSKFLSDSDFGYISGSCTYRCVEPSDFGTVPMAAVVNDFAPSARLSLIREDVGYEKRHSIYVGDYSNDIYQKKRK